MVRKKMIQTLIRRARHDVLVQSHDSLHKMIPKPQGLRYVDEAVHVN